MTPEQFIYWLQGFMEIANPETMDEKQVQILKDHIASVLKKETSDKNVKQGLPLIIIEDKNLKPNEYYFKPQDGTAINLPYRSGPGYTTCIKQTGKQCFCSMCSVINC